MNIDYFMKEAIKEAKKGFNCNEIPIGGLLVDNITKSILARNYNRINELKSAISHCELLLISESCNKLQSKYLKNTTLFITLEPCIMCAAAISEVHISSVYFGAYDEKNGGLDNLFIKYNKKIFTPDIYGGIKQNECSNLLKEFFKNKRI